MKKTVITALLSLACIFSVNDAFAAIGYVDYGKVSTDYSLAKRYTAELDKKLEGIRAYTTSQDKRILAAKTDAEKKAIGTEAMKQLKAKQQDYEATRKRYENDLTAKVVAASEKIRVAKKLDIIIKKDARVTGGVDCTADVLQALNAVK